jgi:hypothetical protein
MSRIGVQKVSVSSTDFFTGVLPSTGSGNSATINVCDFSSATLFVSSSLVSGTGQTSVQVFITPSIGGAFYLAKPAVTSSIGIDDNFIIYVNLANAAQLKAVFTEIGDTGAPSTISASLVMSHQRGATVDGSSISAQTPISTLGDLIVGDVSGSAIRFGIGSAGQVLTVVSGTTSWETPSGGGGGAAPSGTGIVSVTTGSYDVPSSFASLLTAAGGATTTDINNAVQQLDAKQAVYSVETVGNVTPSGVQTVGGITPPDGSRVLLTAQTDPTENTLYTTYDGGGWFATSDSNDSTRLEAGSRVFCQTGDNAGQIYVLRTTGTIGLATAKTWQSLKDSMGAATTTSIHNLFSATLGRSTLGGATLFDPVSFVGDYESLSSADNDFATMITGSGTLTVGFDGDITGMVPVGTNILFAFKTANFESNGPYVLTDGGTVSSPAVFTRRADFNASGDIVLGATFPVISQGGVNELWNLSTSGPYTLDTTPLVFRRLALQPAYLFRTITAATEVAFAHDFTLADATGASQTLTLPDARGQVGNSFVIKKVDATANTVTIDTAYGTIDGAATRVLTTQYQSVTIQSDGTNYWVR